MSQGVHAYPIFGGWKRTLQNWRATMGALKLRSHLRDVDITFLADMDILYWDATAKLFKNGSIKEAGLAIDDITVTANTNDQSVAHTLGVTPTVVWIHRSVGGHVMHGDTADDATQIYLSNIGLEAATVSVILFK